MSVPKTKNYKKTRIKKGRARRGYQRRTASESCPTHAPFEVSQGEEQKVHYRGSILTVAPAFASRFAK